MIISNQNALGLKYSFNLNWQCPTLFLLFPFRLLIRFCHNQGLRMLLLRLDTHQHQHPQTPMTDTLLLPLLLHPHLTKPILIHPRPLTLGVTNLISTKATARLLRLHPTLMKFTMSIITIPMVLQVVPPSCAAGTSPSF